MEVDAVSSTPEVPVVDADQVGINALTADDFLEMLIVELQNQDPTEPISNAELLQQLAQIQSVTANTELTEAIEGIAASNEQLAQALDASTTVQLLATGTGLLSTAAGFIGQNVTGVTADGEVTGTVNRAFVSDGVVFVDVDGTSIPIDDIISVDPGTSGSGSGTAA